MLTIARPDGAIVTPLTADNGKRYVIEGTPKRCVVRRSESREALTLPGSYAAQLNYCESLGCRVRGDL